MSADGTRADKEPIVLAIDGGNTKTDLALVALSGRLLAVVRGGSGSAHALGVERCAELLDGLLDRAVEQASLGARDRPLAAAAEVLVAGADLLEERAALRSEIERLGWSERLRIDNDTPALLRGGTDRAWGICVVCGGGINCLGIAPDGREARFLSFGPISGDWGGGADLGLAALHAAVRAADGRGPHTNLASAVPAHFGLTDPLEVSRAVHLGQLPAMRLGELAPVVLAAADDDGVAAAIVSRLAGEVVAFAAAAVRRLGLTRADPDVVLGGRVLRSVAPSVVEQIDRGIRAVAPGAHVLVSPSEPIVGAVLLGLDDLGADAEACGRARRELDAAAATLQPQQPVTA